MKKIILLLGLGLLTSSCGSSMQRSLFIPRPPDEAFYAAEASFSAVGFGVNTSSKSDGFISGLQAVSSGEGSATTLSVRVSPAEGGSTVNFAIVPAPGMVGDAKGIADHYEKQLKNRINKLTVAPD